MEAIVDALDSTWSASSDLLQGIDGARWDLPTSCPGWSVKDQLAHLVWSARTLVGEQPPDIDLPPLDHVQSPLDEYMERDVQARRPVPGPDVLAEFDDVRRRAIDDLRKRLPDGLDEVFIGPMGMEMPRAGYLPISVFDQWVHGEDLRAALDVAGDLKSGAADVAFARMAQGLGSKVDQPIRLELTGVGARSLTCGDGDPVATITLAAADFVTLAAGRARPTSGTEVTGDHDAASAVLAACPITP